MTTSMSPTIVTYPDGSENAEAVVMVLPELIAGFWCIVTDVTPFHPLDPWWPDQPSDRGEIMVSGTVVPVKSAMLVGIHVETGDIRLNEDKGIKRSDVFWLWSVGHIVEKSSLRSVSLSDRVRLTVDHEYRQAIAAGHTGCHVAAIALNAVTAQFWDKDVRTDSLGHPNTDQELIQNSRILEYGSVDRYRVGKSARKTGFAANRFWSSLDSLSTETALRSNEMLSKIESIVVEPSNTSFHEKRMWKAVYGDRVLEIPCGGVHVANTTRLAPMEIHLTRVADAEFEMNARVAGFDREKR